MQEIIVRMATTLIVFLKTAASFIVARVLAALGLTFVSFEYVLPEVRSYVVDKASFMPQAMSDVMGAVGLDVFMTLILSAYVSRVGMRAFLVGVTQLERMIGNAGG